MKRKSIITRRYDITPAFKAKALRDTCTRLRLVDGKFQHRCFLVNHPDLPGDPPAVGALPEPAPVAPIPCDVPCCTEMALFIAGPAHLCERHRIYSAVPMQQPEPDPKPTTEYKHLYCEDCGKSICYVPLQDYSGALYFCKSCQRNVRVIEDVAPLSPAEQKEAESADNWAKTLDMGGITPPWPGGAA